MESFIDQRRVPRLLTNFPIKISADTEATVTNVSETGIGFACNGIVSPVVKIPLITEISSVSMVTTEKIPVKLVWYKASNANIYQFGACFFLTVTLSQLFSQLR